MAMTLAEMKVGMSDKVAEQVVDTFLRESEILQLITVSLRQVEAP